MGNDLREKAGREQTWSGYAHPMALQDVNWGVCSFHPGLRYAQQAKGLSVGHRKAKCLTNKTSSNIGGDGCGGGGGSVD
eukprot:scaffold239388_cov15-Tisochrysis_lutea.AAC.1